MLDRDRLIGPDTAVDSYQQTVIMSGHTVVIAWVVIDTDEAIYACSDRCPIRAAVTRH